MHPDPQILDQLVQRIVEAVHPLRIILFGSAARGEDIAERVFTWAQTTIEEQR
jgi:hypothetical protein